MAKSGGVPVRFDQAEREALQQAALEDSRSMSALARKIVIEWLRANGFLK